jgi:hypothetical protein
VASFRALLAEDATRDALARLGLTVGAAIS